MRCNVDPDKVSAVEPNDDEGIEQFKANRWDNSIRIISSGSIDGRPIDE
jgi:hypothetical protein